MTGTRSLCFSYQSFSWGCLKQSCLSVQAKEGILQREIVIYSICAAGIIVILLLGMACRRKGMEERVRRSSENMTNQIRELPGIPITANLEEGVYESISDTNLSISNVPDLELKSEYSGSSSSSSSSEGSIIVQIADGYVNPYQPVITPTTQNEYQQLATRPCSDSTRSEIPRTEEATIDQQLIKETFTTNDLNDGTNSRRNSRESLSNQITRTYNLPTEQSNIDNETIDKDGYLIMKNPQ